VDPKEAVVLEVDEIRGVVDALVVENLRSACTAVATIILSITVGIFMPIKPSPMMIPPQHLVPLQ
jgi:hypothetical protein